MQRRYIKVLIFTLAQMNQLDEIFSSYILTKAEKFPKAIESLKTKGYQIIS